MSLTSKHAHTCPTRLWVFVHEVEYAVQRILIDHRIRIEQQDIFRLRKTDSLLVGTRETHILVDSNHSHLRMFLFQHSQGIVLGVVVNDKHLAIDALQGASHTLQTLVQQLADVIANNDYADFLGHTKGIHNNSITPR